MSRSTTWRRIRTQVSFIIYVVAFVLKWNTAFVDINKTQGAVHTIRITLSPSRLVIIEMCLVCVVSASAVECGMTL